MSETTLQPGSTVGGQYELAEKLGEGSMGVVYRARCQSTGEDVAVKLVYYAGMGMDRQEVYDRCAREVEMAASIEHPHAVHQIDFGRIDDGLYIVMEYVDGQTLEQRLERDGAMDTGEVLRVAAAVLDVLHFAHNRGIIHRDLKPGNIMLCTRDGVDVPKVLDFGAAKTLEPEHDLTAKNIAVGTPAYMAPELFIDGELRPGTDLYALGLTLIEALTTQRVVTGRNSILVAKQQISDDPLELPEQLQGHPLAPWLRRAVAKSLDERYNSAADMLQDMGQLGQSFSGSGLDLRSLQEDVSADKTMKMEAVPGLGAAEEDDVSDAKTQLLSTTGLTGGEQSQQEDDEASAATELIDVDAALGAGPAASADNSGQPDPDSSAQSPSANPPRSRSADENTGRGPAVAPIKFDDNPGAQQSQPDRGPQPTPAFGARDSRDTDTDQTSAVKGRDDEQQDPEGMVVIPVILVVVAIVLVVLWFVIM